MAGSTRLSYSEHYVWDKNNPLGKGAAGDVFIARHKVSGDKVAVKVWNEDAVRRPVQIKSREFDILQKLDHINVVSLITVEEENSSRRPVIVMELCNGGSLQDVLMQPENVFGLDEKEFLLVLKDVAAGLKHLRDKGIVHRDIKPGNILRHITPENRHMYKLTDFDAARELPDNVPFASLWGTEEYLHPDIYGKAFRFSKDQQFLATVDIWSLAATLFHCATGHVPFRPYGGREDKMAMYQMITGKEDGVICGHQPKADGKIEYNKELPNTCQLSRAMRMMVTPLMAQMLEKDHQKILKFEGFFTAAAKLLEMAPVWVMCVPQARLIKAFLHPKDSLSELKVYLCEETQIQVEDQMLLYQDCELTDVVTDEQLISTYPETSEDNPIILWHNVAVDFQDPEKKKILRFPTLDQTKVNVDTDARSARGCHELSYLVFRCIRENTRHIRLLRQATQSMVGSTWRQLIALNNGEVQNMSHNLFDETQKRMHSFVSRHALHKDMLQTVALGCEVPIESYLQELEDMVTAVSQDIVKVLEDSGSIKFDLEELTRLHPSRLTLGSHPALQQLEELVAQREWEARADALVKQMREIDEKFQEDRKSRYLRVNESKIHEFEKLNLGQACTEMSSLRSDTHQQLCKVHQTIASWAKDSLAIRGKANRLRRKLDEAGRKRLQLSARLTDVEERYRSKVQEVLQECKAAKATAPAGVPPVAGTGAVGALAGAGLLAANPARLDPKQRDMIKSLRSGLHSIKSDSSQVRSLMDENRALLSKLDEELTAPAAARAVAMTNLEDEFVDIHYIDESLTVKETDINTHR